MDLGVSGLASGFDWRSLVDQLIAVEREPEQTLRTSRTNLLTQKNAYAGIQTQLGTLGNSVASLSDPNLFDSRSAQVGSTSVATATAAHGAALGTYSFNFIQMASAAQFQGTSNLSGPISRSDDVSGVVLGNAAFRTPISSGTFSVDGAQITIGASDSLQSVFDQINSATNGEVNATYNSASDKITLSRADGGEIILGSAADSSNFLQAARLTNNGSSRVSSGGTLGGLQMTVNLNESNLPVELTDGINASGSFTINGVSISYDGGSESLSNILDRITNSAAGVTASYDTVSDRVVLTNKTPGDVGVSVADVQGNFLAAIGLTGGTLQHGSNSIYTINGGGQRSSLSNTIDESSSGLKGLSVTALQAGSSSVTVASDTSKITDAINNFITEYNAAQSMISTQTATSTDSSGKVTAGTLTGQGEPSDIAANLRSIVFSAVPGLSGVVKQLADLGIQTNGYDNTLKLADSTQLDNALANNLDSVKSLFADPTNGIAVKLKAYTDKSTGTDGVLQSKEASLSKQSGDIDTQIANMERIITDDQQRMISSFVAMEQAESKINQQLQYLQQISGGTTTSTTSKSSSSSSSSS